VFTEYGIGLLPGTKVRVVEDDTDVKHVLGVTTFVLPKKPDEVSLLALERLGNDKTLDADAHCGHCHSGHCHCGHCYCGHCGHCHCGSVES
jgi:hypothetical protein